MLITVGIELCVSVHFTNICICFCRYNCCKMYVNHETRNKKCNNHECYKHKNIRELAKFAHFRLE